MKIVDATACVQFGSLEPGEVFGHSGNYYIKTEVNRHQNQMFNAVRLSDGYCGDFKSVTNVRRYVFATLNINSERLV